MTEKNTRLIQPFIDLLTNENKAWQLRSMYLDTEYFDKKRILVIDDPCLPGKPQEYCNLHHRLRVLKTQILTRDSKWYQVAAFKP